MNYSAPLDGLRAIAILAVLVFHVAPSALPGGFAGVDVFFVLSGFLITSIILHDLRVGRFGLKEFYIRRIQRLLPNALLTAGVTVWLWRTCLPPSTAIAAGKHSIWTLLNLSNVYIWRTLGGYWSDTAESAPLLHTWSLAIEEQFYLFFPGSMLALSLWARTRVRPFILLTALVSLVLCVVMTYRAPATAFYWMPTRVWELLLGSGLAAWRVPLDPAVAMPQPLPAKLRTALGWLGLAMVVAACALLRDGNTFPGYRALLPTVGTAFLLLSVADGGTPMARILSHPAMVWVGKLSYSIYLWHWPLIVLGRLRADLAGRPPLLGAALGGVAGFVLAVAAYEFVEEPLRKRGPGRGRRLAVIGAGFALVAAGSGYVATRQMIVDPTDRFDPVHFNGMPYSVGKLPTREVLAASTRYADVVLAPVTQPTTDAWRSGGIQHLYGAPTPEVVVLGSSHAMMYADLLDAMCRELHLSIAYLDADGTPVFFKATINDGFPTATLARAFDAARLDAVRRWHPKLVLAIDRWDLRPAATTTLQTDLHALLDALTPLADQVVLVGQVPVLQTRDTFNAREFVNWRLDSGDALDGLRPDAQDSQRRAANTLLDTLAAQRKNVRVLHPELLFQRADGTIRYAEGRQFFYADDDHLSQAGALQTREVFATALTSVAAAH